MRKKFLSTVLAGAITASIVPWNVFATNVTSEAEPKISEISGSVVLTQETPLMVEFEEIPSSTTVITEAITETSKTTVSFTTTTFVQTQDKPQLNVSAKITEDGYKYYVTGGYIVIEGYEGNDTDLKIPSEIDGKTVKEIGYGAFSGHT